MEIELSLYDKQIEELLHKEKIARQSNNHNELCRILPQIIQIAYDMKEYDSMFNLLLQLSKKRGQAKKALTEMVKLAMSFIDKFEDINLKLNLIQTLKEVTDKKIFLEVEYARCCLMMVKHKEDSANIEEAAKILQEVQVETYGSMDKREKLEFILYQMRIMIKKQDYVRLYIISKKINRKALEDAGIEDLLILYYQYLSQYFVHEKKHLETADCYKQIFLTLKNNQNKQDSSINKIPKISEFGFNSDIYIVFNNFVMYAVIASRSSEKISLLNEIKENHKAFLEQNQNLNNLLQSLLGSELINNDVNSYGLMDSELFTSHVQNHNIHQLNFFKQLLQHNIQIIHRYYERIQMQRLSNLVQVDEHIVEKELCEMINEGLVTGKIDRVDKAINFKKKINENQILNNWVFDTEKVLDMVDRTCNLIKRDTELNK